MMTLAARARDQIDFVISADWSALAALYHPHAGYRDPDLTLTGRDQIVDRLRGQVEALPGCGAAVSHTHTDSGHAPDDGTAGSGTVVVEWTLSAPTGADTDITLDIVTVYEFRDGLIIAERNYWDNALLASELGLEAGA